MVIAVLAAVIVGVLVGVLGGGGSILTVPVLTYVLGMEPHEAIASSLVIVGLTALFGMIPHARARRVRWRIGLIFGAAGMVGAFLGGLLGGVLPGEVLMVAFAVMMIATSAAMLRPRRLPSSRTSPGGEPAPFQSVRIAIDGLLVGIATGVVGAGGGFMIVPALVLLAGLPMTAAVGTSLLVISMKSAAGLSGYLVNVQIDWPLVLGFSAIAIVGAQGGYLLASRIPEQTLRKAFGWFVMVMGVFIIVQEVLVALV
ncbi:sulfite exporter TauE/SafE family protein [Corynebacterium sputi]|uniref:sulfite exporter TauE/SafE family protein n=1 Tax=Corynebacterium sputi TaxID=489915 RepID=UPI000557D958|nr:sulfite exporter TauE/SafE family protein [Corynebacterium sputi]